MRALVELDARRPRRARADGDHDLRRRDPALLAPVAADGERVRVDEAGVRRSQLDVVARQLVADDVDLALRSRAACARTDPAIVISSLTR